MENRGIVLKTKFWRNAAASLPENVRARYLADIAQAERIELAIDAMLEALARPGEFLPRTARRTLITFASPSELNPTPTSSSSG